MSRKTREPIFPTTRIYSIHLAGFRSSAALVHKNVVASYAGSLQLFSPNLADSPYAKIGAGFGSFNSHRVFGEYNSGIVNRKAIYARVSRICSDGYKYNSSNNSKSVFVSGGIFQDKYTWKLNLWLDTRKTVWPGLVCPIHSSGKTAEPMSMKTNGMSSCR